ncbi:MAG: hypothetical protein Q4A29_03960 [Eubacteriales bacterium]|nr:hypothetical protein [Eubacteriales bacterium]
MDKTILLSVLLNGVSLAYLYFTYKKYKEAAEYLKGAEKVKEEAYNNLYDSQKHLERCRKLSAEMKVEGEKLKNVYLNARSKENC